MAVDFRGHPMFPSRGFNTPTRFEADYLVRTPATPVAGAILSSGVYELGDTVSVRKDYYGEDVTQYPQRSSLQRLIKMPLPMLLNWAELDPPHFVLDTEKLIAGRKTRACRP